MMGFKYIIAGLCGYDPAWGHEFARKLKTMGATHFRTFFWKGQLHPIINGKPEYKGVGYSDDFESILINCEYINRNILPCISEVMCEEHIKTLDEAGYKWLQVGARHMGNLHLLRTISANWDGNVVLKRGFGNTLDEWIGAAEHIEHEGVVSKVILCERGSVSFTRDKVSRWTLDFQTAMAACEQGYDVIIDPSHGTGRREWIYKFTLASLVMEFDGVEIEVHPFPEMSPTDARQTVSLSTFNYIMEGVRNLEELLRP